MGRGQLSKTRRAVLGHIPVAGFGALPSKSWPYIWMGTRKQRITELKAGLEPVVSGVRAEKKIKEKRRG